MDNYEQEREKLRTIQTIFEQAVKNNTINDIKPYTDADFSFVSFTDRSFSDFESFSKQWNLSRNEMVGSGSFSTALNPEPSIFIDDIAICYGNAKNNMVDKKGYSFEYTSNWTVIFKRSDSEWKVLRAHNSLDPFYNPMLKSAVKSSLLKFSVFAFVLGGALCSLLTYLILT